MDLATLPGCSPDVYLQDISPDVKALEISPDREKQIVVTINYANESDQIDLEELTSKRESHVTPTEVIEVYSVNERLKNEMQAYLVLNSVRNLDIEGKPLFPTIPVRAMGQAQFKEAWRSLPPAIADAIHTAILIHNPEWGWGG